MKNIELILTIIKIDTENVQDVDLDIENISKIIKPKDPYTHLLEIIFKEDLDTSNIHQIMKYIDEEIKDNIVMIAKVTFSPLNSLEEEWIVNGVGTGINYFRNTNPITSGIVNLIVSEKIKLLEMIGFKILYPVHDFTSYMVYTGNKSGSNFYAEYIKRVNKE